MPTPAESAYGRILLAARARGYTLTRESVALVDAAFRDAIRALGRDMLLGETPLTRARAEAMRRELIAILEELERRVARATERQVSLTVEDLIDIHQRGHARLAERFAPEARAIADGFTRVPARVVAVLAGRRGSLASTFQTLLRRHLLDAGPALDRLLLSAIARGQSSARLAEDIVTLLEGRLPVGVPDDVGGLRSLPADARRIARTETLTALREANAHAMAASPVILAAKWQLSGNHAEQLRTHGPDVCDLLATADLYGFGPGYYPPARWPRAGHPNCACYQGGPTIFRAPSEWLDPLPPVPGMRIEPEDIETPARWTPRETERELAAFVSAVRVPVRRVERRAA